MGLTKEQLELRRQGITATDATAIAGVNRYRSIHDVYLSKVADVDDEAGEAAAVGLELEPTILRMLAARKSLTLSPGTTERHPIWEWAMATPDGNVLLANTRIAVAEAKAVGLRMAHHWGEESDDVPDYVRVQVAWQCVVARVKVAYVAALIGTELRVFEVAHDEDLAMALLDICDKFRRNHILPRIPPPIDGSEGAARMVRSLFPRQSAEMIAAPIEADSLVREYLRADREEKEARARKEAAQTQLCAIAGAHEGLVGPDWRMTWKARDTNGVDWKGLAESLQPDAETVAKFKRPGSRVFAVKETSK